MMKTFVGVDPGAASCLPPFAGLHRITRTDQFILRKKSRDQPVGNTREHLGENADLTPCAAMPANSAPAVDPASICQRITQRRSNHLCFPIQRRIAVATNDLRSRFYSRN
jgi:hypothetical protein